MPIHDWTRVKAGIFHDFHHEWISQIKRALNGGLLPPGYYALAEQIAGGMGPDVLTLDFGPSPGPSSSSPNGAPDGGGVALEVRRPRVRYHVEAEPGSYAGKAKAVVVRHSSDHRVVAMVELVSPGNKASRYAIDQFAAKARQAMQDGVHLLIVDLFPPGPRDPGGLHRLIWDEGDGGGFTLPPDEPLACISYIGGPAPQLFLEPMAVGRALPEEMPLFLDPGHYVPVPIEATYLAAFDAVPAVWRDALASPPLA